MQQLVQSNQCAFIKGRAIHDNFCTMQGATKLLHAPLCPTILLKVDIVRAFDTINWAFLLDLLRHLGFSQRWRDWVSGLLSMASTRIMVNGQPRNHIYHAPGLQQGDPLSLLLFVLSMEALNAIFSLTDIM
jgi:hypothetical protein